jgi:hypothetical protein
MKGEFIVLIGTELHKFDNYEDIPEEFDNVIKFNPDYPPEPHSEEDHELLETYVPKLHELLSRERRK